MGCGIGRIGEPGGKEEGWEVYFGLHQGKRERRMEEERYVVNGAMGGRIWIKTSIL